MMGLRGRVLPTTRENVRLRAEMDSGEVLNGETSIIGTRSRIRRLSLNPSPKPLPEVLRALVNADGIVVGPGSLYTSLLPNLLVEGVAATMSGVDAVRIYVANLMTEPGETDASPSTITCTPSVCTPDTTSSITSSFTKAIWRVPPRAATRCRVHGPSRSMCH